MNSFKHQLTLSLVTCSVLLLTACGGGGGGGGSSDHRANTNSVATAVKSAAPVANCPNGGITVDAGIDSNGNRILDAAEVTSTQYVCNGANGTSGLSTLVLVTGEAAGANCANGGKKVSAGQDANGNGVLDATEVASTGYVCNGAVGQTGTNGSNGANGAAGLNGTNGTNGTNGLNSLVAIVPEPAGTFCTYGGNKVSSGGDSNTNGILDAAEITSSNYVCNGAPGATGATGPAGSGVTWANVTASSSVQATSNMGYMANSAVQVTITLPVAPALGDVVQVTGVGTGGWKIAQNAGQSIITQGIAGSAAWTRCNAPGAKANTQNWTSVASSVDGTKLVAAATGEQIYTSTDSGVTWTARESARNWSSVASSADGTKLVAAVTGGQLYTSTDSGLTWAPRDAARNWSSVASSADGTKLAAADNGGVLYTSLNSGVTWMPFVIAGGWTSVAMSADGSKRVATDPTVNKKIYTSTDFGTTWVARNSPLGVVSVASSADGSKLIAGVNGGQLYTSIDSGVTWSPRDAIRNWSAVVSSADGSKLIASDSGPSGLVYTSIDSGANWISRLGFVKAVAVASSADGNKLIAAEANTGGLLGGFLHTMSIGTTSGQAGSLSGARYESVNLQCVDANTFVVRGYVGNLVVQ